MTGNQTASQTVVVVAMGLVAGASAVALYQHAGLPGPVAATVALSAYLMLLTVHAYIWRAGRSTLPSQPRDRREQEVRRLKKDEGRAGPAAKGARGPLPAGPSQTPAAEPPRSAAAPQRAAGPTPPPLPPLPRHATAERTPPPLPGPHAQPTMPQAHTSMPQAHPGAGAADTLHEAWAFRPVETTDRSLPPFVTGRVTGRAEPTLAGSAPIEPALPPALPAAGPREADVEVIQDAIKRMLEDISAAEHQEATPPHGTAHSPPPLPGSAIDRSIDALRMTAGAMRSATAREAHVADAPYAAPPAPQGHLGPEPPPLPPFVRGTRASSPAETRARLMADAISAGRIDVALEPILGLEDQQTRHYEVSVRLRDADGRPLDIMPDGPDLRGTGLLPLFDGVRIARTAAVARRLEERGKNGSVFSTFSGESVADEHFLGELAETLHQRAGLATQLVLSFTQSDVRGFSTPEWDSLADMRALGFRFALSAITDLDMDFEALGEQGFVFVKLDASVFLDGLPAPSGHLPSSDVCRHLASHGLTLVVEHIDDEDKLARVFGFGVLLGQGQLFGGPRAVRADVVAHRQRTVAA